MFVKRIGILLNSKLSRNFQVLVWLSLEYNENVCFCPTRINCCCITAEMWSDLMDETAADDTMQIIPSTSSTANERYLFGKPKTSNELTAPSI